MTNGKHDFPIGWPSDCPPAEATQSELIVYRTVRSDPPTKDDFLTYFELGKRVSKKQKCDACGLSVMGSLGDAIHHREVLPWETSFIAQGKLTAEQGKTMPTPTDKSPSHLTWWIFENVIREQLFAVIEV